MSAPSHKGGCKGCLIAAVIVSIVFAALVVLFWPVGWSVPFSEPPPVCLSQIRQLMTALLGYARDHQDRLPSVTTWEQDVAPYLLGAEAPDPQEMQELFLQCGEPGELGKVRHVMVQRWSGVKLGDIPDPASAIVIYDAVDGRQAFRHRPYYENRYQQLRNRLAAPGLGIGYADGHCRWANDVTAEMIAKGRDTTLAEGQ